MFENNYLIKEVAIEINRERYNIEVGCKVCFTATVFYVYSA